MNDNLAGPATRAPLKRKSAILAVALQCLPLLFLGSIIAHLRLPEFRETVPPLLGLLALLGFLWGTGYAYLGRANRFVLILPLGALLALNFSCVAFPVSFMDSLPCQVLGSVVGIVWLVLIERPIVPFEIMVGLVVGGAVLLLAVDAWRLAEAHNARADEQERAETSV